MNKKNSFKKRSVQRHRPNVNNVLDTTILKKTIKNKGVKNDVKHQLQNTIKNRDRNIRMLINSKQNHQSQIVRAYKRNIISNQKQVRAYSHFLICNERAERRRKLFALGRAGNGIKGPTRKVKTYKSKVRC